jgi:hypothetical protein
VLALEPEAVVAGADIEDILEGTETAVGQVEDDHIAAGKAQEVQDTAVFVEHIWAVVAVADAQSEMSIFDLQE